MNSCKELKTAEHKRELELRRKSLDDDEQFSSESHRVASALDEIRRQEPKLLKNFVDHFGYPILLPNRRLSNFMKKVSKEDSEPLLLCLDLMRKFDVVLIDGGNLGFHFEPAIPKSQSYQFNLVAGMPKARPGQDDLGMEAFAHSNSVPLESLKSLIELRKAAYIHVRESQDTSLLRIIEDFGYQRSGLTILIHERPEPFLYFLFGENVSKQWVRKAEKIVTEFQRKNFRSAKGGRPVDLGEQKKVLQLLRHNKRLKEIAAELAGPATERRFRSKQTKVTRIRKRLRERDSARS